MLEYPLSSAASFQIGESRHHSQRRRDVSRFPPLLTGTSASTSAETSLPTSLSLGVEPLTHLASASSASASSEDFLPAIGTTKRRSTTRRPSSPTGEKAENRLLRKPTDASKRTQFRIGHEILSLDPSTPSDWSPTMTAPMFSVRPCPRYEKPTVAAASIGSRRTFESLFPNVRNLLKSEFGSAKREKIIDEKSKTNASSPPIKATSSFKVPSLSSALEGAFKPSSKADSSKQKPSSSHQSPSTTFTNEKLLKTNKTPPTPSSTSTANANTTTTTSSNAPTDARRRPSTSSRRPKDVRPGSRKGAKSRRKKRKTTIKRDGNDENDGRNNTFNDYNKTIERRTSKKTRLGEHFETTQNTTKTRNDKLAVKLTEGANSNGDDFSSVVKLLSRKLSGLGIYKRANQCLRNGGGIGSDQSPSITENNADGRKENLTNQLTNGLTVVGKRGKMEAKSLSSPSQTQSKAPKQQLQQQQKTKQPQQPVIFGKFTSSFSLSESLSASKDADEDNDDSRQCRRNDNDNHHVFNCRSDRDHGKGNGDEQNVDASSFSSAAAKTRAKKELDAPSAATTTKRNDDPTAKAGVGGGKNVKIYLSNKQTCDVRAEGGVTICGAPPATPRESYARFVDFVPAMSDVRSQRQLRNTLTTIEQKQKAKAERLELAAKDADAERRKEAAVRLKAAQRREIYELNRIMEELENQNFRQFCRSKGIEAEI